MLDWIMRNKEWLFSGIGIVAVTALFGVIQRMGRKHRRLKSSAVADRWKPVRELKGHWSGRATEHMSTLDVAHIFEMTWDFEVENQSIKGKSTARGVIDGVLYEDTYSFAGTSINERILQMDFRNDKTQELNCGSQMIELGYDGRSFSGIYVGFIAGRAKIVSGTLEARKTN
jgi:hypothetical protein